MEIKKEMKFRGNVNNVEFLITNVNKKTVAYKVLLKGSKISDKVHTFGRKAFEQLNITEITV